MGLPGDMNLELLDYINDVDGLNWGTYKSLTEGNPHLGTKLIERCSWQHK